MDVEGDLRKGNWLFVRIHRRNIRKVDARKVSTPTYKWGWSILKEHEHIYLLPQEGKENLIKNETKFHEVNVRDSKESVSDKVLPTIDSDEKVHSSFHRTFSFKPSKETVEWTQCTDERGRIYYFNPITSDSRKVSPKSLCLTHDLKFTYSTCSYHKS